MISSSLNCIQNIIQKYESSQISSDKEASIVNILKKHYQTLCSKERRIYNESLLSKHRVYFEFELERVCNLALKALSNQSERIDEIIDSIYSIKMQEWCVFLKESQECFVESNVHYLSCFMLPKNYSAITAEDGGILINFHAPKFIYNQLKKIEDTLLTMSVYKSKAKERIEAINKIFDNANNLSNRNRRIIPIDYLTDKIKKIDKESDVLTIVDIYREDGDSDGSCTWSLLHEILHDYIFVHTNYIEDGIEIQSKKNTARYRRRNKRNL